MWYYNPNWLNVTPLIMYNPTLSYMNIMIAVSLSLNSDLFLNFANPYHDILSLADLSPHVDNAK